MSKSPQQLKKYGFSKLWCYSLDRKSDDPLKFNTIKPGSCTAANPGVFGQSFPLQYWSFITEINFTYVAQTELLTNAISKYSHQKEKSWEEKHHNPKGIHSYRYFLQAMRTPNSLPPAHAHSAILLLLTHVYTQLNLYAYTMVYTLAV